MRPSPHFPYACAPPLTSLTHTPTPTPIATPTPTPTCKVLDEVTVGDLYGLHPLLFNLPQLVVQQVATKRGTDFVYQHLPTGRGVPTGRRTAPSAPPMEDENTPLLGVQVVELEEYNTFSPTPI